MNKRRRPSIRVKLRITSNDDDRFSTPITFDNMQDASRATGLKDRGLRMAYSLGRESMKKRNGFIYCFKWEEPDPITASFAGIPRTFLKECKRCSKTSRI